MNLFEMFNGLGKKKLVEGGNVSSQSPGWQGAPDQEAEEIDLKIHDRDFMVGKLSALLAAQNESFKAAYGKYIWDPKLLKSGKMFSGSSLQFFDIKSVSTQDFLNKLKKTKVGDIDTQIDQDMGDEVTAWLKSIIGKKVGNGTFLGFNSSLSSIWLLDDPPVRVQIDYELGPYDPKTKSPTEWFAYSHSSHYDDMAAGIKGVFHKYINRALTHAQASTKYVARVLKKGVKISDEPVTDSDYSFAVSSAQGGGMSLKYKPYIDPATGQPMEKDGIPVMVLLDPKDRDYIQNLDQQFQINFGRKRTAKDQNLQGSFVGTLQLMNKAFSPEQNEAVARAFLDILFGRGSQMITKDDPARDRDIKFAAVDAMLLGGGGIAPLNLPNGKALRQEAVKMAMDYADAYTAKRAGKAESLDTEVAEDTEAAAAAKPNYARQGIKHLYNRLPDGRISSVEMKDAEFLEVAKEIADNGGTLDGFPINLKVDGAGIRFGKDESGRPFFMTSKVTQPLYQDDVGYFTSFGQQRGQDPEQLARTKKYDDALALITGSKFIQTLPPDTIVQAEMLYNPMAEKTDQGLKFVNISYDPSKLGGQMTLVPFMFKQYSTGEERPDADKIKKRLLAAGDKNIKIISNGLDQKGINVSKIINPILGLDPKDKNNKPAFDKAKQELSTAIIDNPKLGGKDALGSNMEGIVVNMPSGRLFKVTSQQMKSAMAAKLAQPGAKRQGPLKTAVVAIGSFAGHKGHEELFNYTINKAKELGGEPYLFIGNAVGADDPIPPDVKVETWHKLYPEYAKNISAVMQGGSIMQKVKHELINPQPGKPPKYDNIVIMVGEDRKDMPIANALMKAVNKFPGYEHVKASLEVTPRGTGMSFTKLRNILKDPNATPEQQLQLWSQGFNVKKLGVDYIKKLMDVTKKGMGVQTPVPTGVPMAEMRLFNALMRPTLNEYGDTAKGQKMLTKVQKRAVDRVTSKKADTDPAYAKKNKTTADRAWDRMSDKDVAEGYDKWGWHTSVKNGEFMPTKYGNKAYVYLHDMDNQSANGNPQLVTVNKPTVAKRIAQQFGGKVVKTDLNTYRIVKPAEQGMAEGDSPAMAQTAKRLTDPKDGAVAKLRAAGDKRREDHLKSRDIAKKNEGMDNPEYDDEAGMAQSNLVTTARAVKGLLDTIKDKDNLPEWAQEKIAKAEMMLVGVWDYLLSQKELGTDPKINEAMMPASSFVGSKKNKLGTAGQLKGSMKRPARAGDLVGEMDEDWQSVNKKDKTDGMSPKAVKAYRRENPGSKLKTAVTTKPSKLKAGSKDAKRRKSFCARMSGNKGPMKDEKGRPTPKAKALARWNCEEGIEKNRVVPLGEAWEVEMIKAISKLFENKK